MQVDQAYPQGLQARTFGRKGVAAAAAAASHSTLIDDVKLFALTFAGGFLFTALYIA
jgi:hypothetical protein